MKRIEFITLVLILTIAAGARFSLLNQGTPPGMLPQEGLMGTEALEINRTGHLSGEVYAMVTALSVRVFGNTAAAVRYPAALAGVLTVLGTYLLARRMFNDWRLAAMTAFLMAVSFWPVHFSRLGLPLTLAPLIAVWSLYYLLVAVGTHRLWYWGLSGALLAASMYTDPLFRVMPIVTAITLLTYWVVLHSSFDHEKYAYTRGQFLGNCALLFGVALLGMFPLLAYSTTPSSTFNPAFAPHHTFLGGIATQVSMFFFSGDRSWQHGIPGSPLLFWPIAALCAVGVLHVAWRLGHNWQHRGHPGVPHVLLLSWCVLGVIAAARLPGDIPNALSVLPIAPAIFIITAVGLHWLFEILQRWYTLSDVHRICLPGPHGHQYCTSEGRLVTGITLVIFLLALGIGDLGRYFVQWSRNPIAAQAMSQQSVDVAAQITSLPPAVLKYVVIDTNGTSVNGVPLAAQPLMYLTHTSDFASQQSLHVKYLTPDQYARLHVSRSTLVFRITQ